MEPRTETGTGIGTCIFGVLEPEQQETESRLWILETEAQGIGSRSSVLEPELRGTEIDCQVLELELRGTGSSKKLDNGSQP